MVKLCESCYKSTEDDEAQFCRYCGSRFIVTEIDALKGIRSEVTTLPKIIAILENYQKTSEEVAKKQIFLSYATLILAAVAIIIGVGALGMAFYAVQPDQKPFGALLLVVIVTGVAFFLVKGISDKEKFLKKKK